MSRVQNVFVGLYTIFDARFLAGSDEIVSDADLAWLKCLD
jgi:hypothetical protein